MHIAYFHGPHDGQQADKQKLFNVQIAKTLSAAKSLYIIENQATQIWPKSDTNQQISNEQNHILPMFSWNSGDFRTPECNFLYPNLNA